MNDFAGTDHSALHLAAENNLSEICSILLSNGADFTAVDSRGNNSLHLAVKEGHLASIRVLLTESQVWLRWLVILFLYMTKVKDFYLFAHLDRRRGIQWEGKKLPAYFGKFWSR